MAAFGAYEEVLCCSICFEKYQENGSLSPLVLQCGHTFCRGCLSRLQQCAECRRPLPLSIEMCPRNLALVRLISISRGSPTASTSSPAPPAPTPDTPSRGLPMYLIHEMYSMTCEQLQHDLLELGIVYDEGLRIENLIDLFHAHPEKVCVNTIPILGNPDDGFLRDERVNRMPNSALGSAFNTGGIPNTDDKIPIAGRYYHYDANDFNHTRIRVKVVKLDPPDGESVIIRLPNGQERSTTFSRIMGSGMLSRQVSAGNSL